MGTMHDPPPRRGLQTYGIGFGGPSLWSVTTHSFGRDIPPEPFSAHPRSARAVLPSGVGSRPLHDEVRLGSRSSRLAPRADMEPHSTGIKTDWASPRPPQNANAYLRAAAPACRPSWKSRSSSHMRCLGHHDDRLLGGRRLEHAAVAPRHARWCRDCAGERQSASCQRQCDYSVPCDRKWCDCHASI